MSDKISGRLRHLSLVGVVGLLGVLGLQWTSAATYVVFGEAESGTVAGRAETIHDGRASAGAGVRFGSDSRLGAQAGVVSDITWGMSRADMDRSVAMMQQAGVEYIRANISWSGVEPTAKGVYSTSYENDMEYGVDKALAAGIKVLIDVADGTPYWASCDPARSEGKYNPYWRPCDFRHYADYYTRVVNKYKSKGIHIYEVGNEPNHPVYWPSGISAADYTAMLKAAHAAIKAADPSARVMVGGLSKGDYSYVQQLYDAGARPYFDIMAIHPYTSTDPTMCWNQGGTTKKALDAFCSIEEVRAVMVANGDAAKDIWLTEFGWSTSTAEYSVTEAQQADFTTKAFTKMRNEYPYVTVAMVYMFHDTGTDRTDWNSNAGIIRNDYSSKPALAAFRTIASQ